MKVSIVMPYYNRRRLLETTLKTIAHTKHKDLEIVIVDDGSDEEERIETLRGFRGLKIKIIRVNKEEKWWSNTCVPINKGIFASTGDIIIIQSAECMHIGDIVSYSAANVVQNKYYAFSCYSINQQVLDKIVGGVNFSCHNCINDIKVIIRPMTNTRPVDDCQNGWYCHSEINPCAFHFTAAITRADLMQKLNGFDETYANGLGFEDFEFLRRIRERNINVHIVDDPFVIHQPHVKTDYAGKKELHERNRILYTTGKIT